MKIHFEKIEPNIDYDDIFYLNIYLDDMQIGYVCYEFFVDVELSNINEPSIIELLEYREFYYIHQIEIFRDYRGEGYGNLLLQEFVNNILEFRFDCVLYKDAFNYPSNEQRYFFNEEVLPKFYESYDFKNVGYNYFFLDNESNN